MSAKANCYGWTTFSSLTVVQQCGYLTGIARYKRSGRRNAIRMNRWIVEYVSAYPNSRFYTLGKRGAAHLWFSRAIHGRTCTGSRADVRRQSLESMSPCETS